MLIGVLATHQMIVFKSAFQAFYVQHGFYQFVNSPTRASHCLDLVLSTDLNIVSNLCVLDPFSTSDHS